MESYIAPDPESGKKFYQDFHDKGEVVMLNLLKFKEKADYRDWPSLKPHTEITGKEAYQLYINKTLPILKKIGSRVIFYGRSKSFLIGPTSENWDAVILVAHPSAQKFIEFAQNEEYLKHAGHRNAALEDSRLLPITEQG